MPDRKKTKPITYELQEPIQEPSIPRLWTLRRIPGRYRHFLPVAVMKRYQCVVIGGDQSILTVAITEPKNTALLNTLRLLTGCTIFPVFVDPTRMRLLIRRIESLEYNCYTPIDCLARYYALQQRSMLLFLISRYQGYFDK
jgi:Type II secretion system (T2SS), protein E, N-terminal domain